MLLNHPEAKIVFANSESNAGNLVSDVHEGLIGDTDLRFTDEAFMYIADEIAGITLRVCKDNLCLRMVQQQTNQFSACIACCT